MALSIEQRVQKGMRVLDLRWPGWEQRIDLGRLDVISQIHCILGQLYGRYDSGLSKLREDDRFANIGAMDHGFTFRCRAVCDALTEAWKEEIRRRRAA